MNREAAYKICEVRNAEVLGADTVCYIHMSAQDNAAESIAENGGNWRETGVDAEFLRCWAGSVGTLLSDCKDAAAVEFFAGLGIHP